MTAEEKSVLSLFMIGVLIVVGKVLAGGEPITPRLFIGRMLLGGFVSMVAGVVLVQFPDLSLPAVPGVQIFAGRSIPAGKAHGMTPRSVRLLRR
ncbi:phage holin family protein [Escherichia coli]|nr:phage holin family protein [Escherichia coli]